MLWLLLWEIRHAAEAEELAYGRNAGGAMQMLFSALTSALAGEMERRKRWRGPVAVFYGEGQCGDTNQNC